MKQINSIIISLVLMVSFTSCSENKAESWQQIENNNGGAITLKYVASDGFAYYDEDGNLTGVTSEIFHDFVNWVENEYRVSLDVRYKPYESWSQFYADVRDSESGTFGMGNVTITDARWEELDFSPAYMINIAVLISHEDTPELSSFDVMANEFAHLKALAFEGTLHETRLRNFKQQYFPAMDISYAHSNNEIIENVAASDAWFAYVDVYNFWRAKDAGTPLRQHSIADEPSEQFGYILPNNSDWTPIIARFFEADGSYLNSERYQGIMRTHLGEGLAEMLDEARRNLQ